MQLLFKGFVDDFFVYLLLVAFVLNHLYLLLLIVGFSLSFLQVNRWSATTVFLALLLSSGVDFSLRIQDPQHLLLNWCIWLDLFNTGFQTSELMRSFSYLFFD